MSLIYSLGSCVTGEHAEGTVGYQRWQPTSVLDAAVYIHPSDRTQGAHSLGDPHAAVHVAGTQSRRSADLPCHPVGHRTPHHTCESAS